MKLKILRLVFWWISSAFAQDNDDKKWEFFGGYCCNLTTLAAIRTMPLSSTLQDVTICVASSCR